jgi:nucleotide-binding universal stress UspA family protein
MTVNDKSSISVTRAIQDFHSARQKAILQEIVARFTGGSIELLSFDEVRQKLKAQVFPKKELKEIPLTAIIGSVNRYQDFLRDFLPGRNVTEERWANVERANYGMKGLPPIEVYQIGQVYFVSDGNHRVSVARQIGALEIQAYVTEVHTRVPLTPDVKPEDLIIMAEYTEFLEHTDLDRSRPEANLSVTVPGQYEVVEEHIAVHRYFMGIEQQRDIQEVEAASDWYDTVYLPIAQIIRDRGLLVDFPNRTELDLYLWIAEHRAAIEDEVKSQVEVNAAAEDLADQFSQRPYRIIARLGNNLIKTLVPNSLDQGPATGEWRLSIQNAQKFTRLFNSLLVPINGLEDGWFALDQAAIIAQREQTVLNGFYIQGENIDAGTPSFENIQGEFERRCQSAGVSGEIQMKVGDVTENICERARWNDLVVMNLSYPPEPSLFARLSSGIRNLVQRCPRPILFTPRVISPLNHALLAYDGSLKAQEGLFIATYVTAQWGISLSIITIGDSEDAAEILDDARRYIEVYNVQAGYELLKGDDRAGAILNFAHRSQCDFLIVGGYSRNPILEVLQGGDVDELLRESDLPILICR